jgi:hypothetical protein
LKSREKADMLSYFAVEGKNRTNVRFLKSREKWEHALLFCSRGKTGQMSGFLRARDATNRFNLDRLDFDTVALSTAK